MKSLYASIAMTVMALGGAQAEESKDWLSLVDMKRADISSFSMVMMNAGEEAGGMTYGWAREGDTYVISDRTTMKPNILETARGVIDARTLMPKSVEIDFAIGERRNLFDISWQGDIRTGHIKVHNPGTEDRIVDVSGDNSSKSIIRLSIFGLIAAMPLEEGFSVDIPWYNSLSNSNETIRLVHAGFETVETPAGTYDAHRIDLKQGTPENIVYVTRSVPQKIVRIDVVGQPMYFERLP